MRTISKQRTQHPTRKSSTSAAESAVDTIRKIGEDWAKNWNDGELDKVVALYSEDAVYLPPHHEAVHGRDSIRDWCGTATVHCRNGQWHEAVVQDPDGSPSILHDTAARSGCQPEQDAVFNTVESR